MQKLATEPPPASLFESSLDALRAQIDVALDAIRANPAEARRIVTRDLVIVPQPSELDAIVRIARDPLSRDTLRELSCTALTLRILAERSIRDLMEPNRTHVESVARAATIMSGLLEARDTWEQEIYRESEAYEDARREFLLQIADALLPQAEPLIAGTILAPRLLSIVRAAENDPRAAVKSLTCEDVELIRGVCGRDRSSDEGAGATALTAIALRTVIEDDVALWRSLDASEPVEQDDRVPLGELLQRMRKERTAYRYVSGLLQTHRAAALGAGLEAFSTRFVGVQGRLFAAYLTLVPILNAQGDASSDAEAAGPNAAADKLDRLLRESAQLDALADTAWSQKVTAEEVCLKALKGMKQPASPVLVHTSKARGLRDPRARMRVMLSVAALLLVACVGLYGSRMLRADVDLRVPTGELSVRLELIDTVAIGSMLHATVSGWTWDELDPFERVENVSELGARASERGLSAVYLTDEEQNQLAVWNRDEGVRLADTAP